MLQTSPEEFVSSAREPGRDDLEFWTFTLYLLRNWRVFALACGIAIPSVLLTSFLLPKKYTAVASILIEPPAGNDPRGSTAVSPVYLESLKTYEHFASSDSLFRKSLDDLSLRQEFAGTPIETIKRRVLRVSKPRDTKVLEVSATLANPSQARDLARYIATRTVQMNLSLSKTAALELTEGGNAVLAGASARLTQARSARVEALEKEPIAALELEVSSSSDLKARLEREISEADVETAAYQARQAGRSETFPPAESDSIAEAITAAKAQASNLRMQLSKLKTVLGPASDLLEVRKHRRELLDKELQAAQAEYEAANTRNSEMLASVAFRGERLEIIDPGLLPERPSSPNIPLNVAIAALAATLGSICYLLCCFSYARRRVLGRFAHPGDRS